MFAIILLALYGFAWGIRRGASACLALCMPAIIPALVREKGGWKKGFMVALYFNLPRIFLLTLLGAVMGAGGYALITSLESFTVGGTAWSVGYAVIGCMMIVYGTYLFATVSERLDNLADGEVDCEARISHPIYSRFRFAAPTTRLGLILWGGVISIACIGETVIAVEGLMVMIFSGTTGSDPATSALIGALVFFMLALGSAFPSLVLSSFSSTLASREKRIQRLYQVERLAAALMIGFGAIFLLSAIFIIS